MFLKVLCYVTRFPQGLFCSPKMTPRKKKHAFYVLLLIFVNFEALRLPHSLALPPERPSWGPLGPLSMEPERNQNGTRIEQYWKQI